MGLKDKFEDEFAERDGQLDVANLMARCTICKAKVAELCGACTRAWPLKAPRGLRESDREEQVHDLGPWVLRARPRGARAWDGAIDGVNSGVMRRNT